MIAPTARAACAGWPVRTATRAATATVTTTWIAPPARPEVPIAFSRRHENSSPIAKSKTATPSSAKISTSESLWTSPAPFGPSNMPASRKPTIAL